MLDVPELAAGRLSLPGSLMSRKRGRWIRSSAGVSGSRPSLLATLSAAGGGATTFGSVVILGAALLSTGAAGGLLCKAASTLFRKAISSASIGSGSIPLADVTSSDITSALEAVVADPCASTMGAASPRMVTSEGSVGGW
jgi:hypothetical protein